jgi:hypothetical protein
MAKLYYIAPVEFECTESPITVGDNKFPARMPFDGEILGNRSQPCITGCIMDAGAGAGTATQIQLRNVTQGRDYFTTEPEFKVNDIIAGTRAPLSGGQLGSNPTCKAGDWLALDVDGLPGGANSALAFVVVLFGFWREV